MKSTEHKYTNSLIDATSPYLLQHAHNPVNWYAWNDETLEKAKLENKIILISIGYSACHWCHVMEHESFEDEHVAQLMNNYFICIKVDREERPDIDQVYMLAVQLMTGHGGWPLNCFALPDGRPIYGGTYFPKQQWLNILLNLSEVYRNDPDKVLEYAKQLTEGVKLAELVKTNEQKAEFTIDTLHLSYNNWKINFDAIEGGPNKAPKFPLPNNYQFLLNYYHHTKNKEVLEHLELTLLKMAYGGIYDQIGGGFSRYSVDHYWKVPHFEKMLYDNAQLVSLYSQAFQETKNPLYKQIVFETLAFIERELTSQEGAFYSALDADSEGEEGKYYVWKKEELQTILKENYNVFADYYNIHERGLWEHDNYILLRHDSDEIVAKKNNIGVDELQKIIADSKKTLLGIREKRVRPGLDDKTLTSWNALMLKAYIDAYNVFDEQHFLDVAIKNATFILKKQLHEDGGLNHNYKNGKSTINGYLEDYCFIIEALIAIYEATFEEMYLLKANELMTYCIVHFQDKNSGMFYFTSDEDKALITRKMELSDNVIPASNSSIAKSLFRLGHHFENESYIDISKKMLNNMLTEIEKYGAGYSNWGMLLLNYVQPFYEVAIVGKAVDEKRKALNKHYLPNVIFAGSKKDSMLPLIENRYVKDKTLIYVCSNKTCKAPVDEVSEAVHLLLNNH
jgi:uncharacterized protein YyaL (SSP411 family)